MVRAGLFVLLLFLSATAQSCVTTKAYERELLAKKVMAPDPDADREALRSHLIGTREGAVGGLAGGGGGCGCN